ncbi:hypothetical protein [Streptomyces sp. NPDC007100]|uniref:hypothetical protein n=1 Tax=Streptomyces sp. NPDC007100 TaxID=3155602 RepID=UPI0033D9E7E7
MFFAASRRADTSAPASAARPGKRAGKRAGLRAAAVTVAAGAAVAVPAVAAVAAPADSAAPAPSASAAASHGVKKVKIANHYTLAWDGKAGTTTVLDPDGDAVGVLSDDNPGPVTSDFGDQGKATYTMDSAMSTATVHVNDNGKVKDYSFLKG